MASTNYDSKDNNKKENNRRVMAHKKYLMLAVGSVIITVTFISIIMISTSNQIPEAEASDFASLAILRWGAEPQNPKLPVQHLSTYSIETSNSKTAQIISIENNRYDPRLRDQSSLQVSLSKAEALAIIQTIPFTYHDYETLSGYDIHSANIEVDGKYYQVVLTISK